MCSYGMHLQRHGMDMKCTGGSGTTHYVFSPSLLTRTISRRPPPTGSGHVGQMYTNRAGYRAQGITSTGLGSIDI
jgi:hypothetical protein